MSLDTASPELEFAFAAVRKASALSLRIQTGMAMMGLTKSDFSPVTVADFAAQAVVAKALDAFDPDSVLVGEEDSSSFEGDKGQEVLKVVVDFVGKVEEGASQDEVCKWIDKGTAEPTDSFWTLDPIDGTKGYLRGGQFAVALAHIENGQVTFGVLGCPNLAAGCRAENFGEGVIVAAVRGQGAWWAPLDNTEPFKRIEVSDCADMESARLFRSVEAAHTNIGLIDKLSGHLGVKANHVAMDSQAKYAVLAAGNGEILFRLLSPKKPDYREMIWDQAAGSIILEEAGGRITDLDGKALDFTHGRRLEANRGICASNATLHETALKAIAEIEGSQ